jgi:hypothetical protein
MKQSYIAIIFGALVATGAALSMPSCGHDQKLTGLTITPTTFTFLQPGFTPPPDNPTEQYTVIATYIHPPETKDVTSQATWTIDDGVATVSSSGLVSATLPPPDSQAGTPGPCGVGDILVSVPEGTGGSSNIVTAVATVVVDNPADVLCPGGGKLGTLAVGVFGSGRVTSLPAAISCTATGGTCIATFDVGASVVLTATSVPTWQNCPSGVETNTCVVTIATGGTAVSATF